MHFLVFLPPLRKWKMQPTNRRFFPRAGGGKNFSRRKLTEKKFQRRKLVFGRRQFQNFLAEESFQDLQKFFFFENSSLEDHVTRRLSRISI